MRGALCGEFLRRSNERCRRLHRPGAPLRKLQRLGGSYMFDISSAPLEKLPDMLRGFRRCDSTCLFFLFAYQACRLKNTIEAMRIPSCRVNHAQDISAPQRKPRPRIITGGIGAFDSRSRFVLCRMVSTMRYLESVATAVTRIIIAERGHEK